MPNYRLPDSCREEIETVTQTISDYSYDFGQSLKEHSAKIIDETPEFLYCTSSIFVVIDQTTLITDLCNGTYDKEKTKQRSSKNYKSFMKGATNALIDLGVGIFETPDLIADIYYGTEDIKAEVKDVVKKSNGDVTQIYEYATSKISALKEGIIETKDEAVEYVTNMNEDDIYESAGYITLTVLSLFVGGEASKASNISKVSEVSKVEKVLKTGKTGFWDDLVNKVKGKSSSVKNKVSKGKGSYKGTAPVENSKYLDDINDFYEGIFDEQRLVDPEYEDYLDDLSELNKVSQDDIGLEMNESPEPEASSGHQSGRKSIKELISESDAAKKWGVLDDGTNQGVKHFCDYWEKYPERIPSLEKRLGMEEGAFNNSLDGFNNFTTQAERVIAEATSTGNIRNINGKTIYYVDGVANPKKGVVVIVIDGKIQSMMPSEVKTFNKLK